MKTKLGAAFNFHTDTANGYFEKSFELMRDRDYDAAENVARQGMADFPGSSLLVNQLGHVLKRVWKDDEALEAFAKAHEMAPDNLFYAIDYAAFLGKRQYHKEAELLFLQTYEPANGATRENLFALTGLGHMYSNVGDHEKAVLCFGEAKKLDTEDLIAARRYDEERVKARRGYTQTGWKEFMEYAQDLINDAGNQICAVADEPKLQR